MGSACPKDFLKTSCWLHPQHSTGNSTIGAENEDERYENKNGACDHEGQLISMSINAWQSKQCWNFTEEMVHLAMSTQGYPGGKWGMKCQVGEATYPRSHSQQMAETRVHEDSVMQGSTYSCITVIGHHHQQHTSCGSQCKGKVKLSHATYIRHGFSWAPEVDQQLGDEAGRDAEKTGLRGRSTWECADGSPGMIR